MWLMISEELLSQERHDDFREKKPIDFSELIRVLTAFLPADKIRRTGFVNDPE